MLRREALDTSQLLGVGAQHGLGERALATADGVGTGPGVAEAFG